MLKTSHAIAITIRAKLKSKSTRNHASSNYPPARAGPRRSGGTVGNVQQHKTIFHYREGLAEKGAHLHTVLCECSLA